MNLESKDLRIGNIVLDDSSYHIINWLSLQRDNRFNALIITDNTLIKAGFKKDIDGCFTIPYCKDYSFYWLDTGFLQIAKGYAPLTNAPCKYLHQLQNLIFALTGEELQINY